MRHSIRYSYSEVFILCYQTDCVVCSDLGFNLHINASLGSGGGSAGRRRVGDTIIMNLNITLIEDGGTGDPEASFSVNPTLISDNTGFLLPTLPINSGLFRQYLHFSSDKLSVNLFVSGQSPHGPFKRIASGGRQPVPDQANY